LNHRLNRANFKNVFLFSYGLTGGSFENHVEQLSQLVLQIHERLPDQKIHFVGHSLGGMVALSALQNPKITPFCEKLITLGTPFRGTKLAHLAVTRLGKCLRPGHPFLADFQEAPKGIHVISIWSDFDALILPGESSEFQGGWGESIRVNGIGHTGLCFSRKIADLIVERL